MNEREPPLAAGQADPDDGGYASEAELEEDLDVLASASAGPAAVRGGALRVGAFAASASLALGSGAVLYRHLGPVGTGQYKCEENRDWERGYREDDAIGGHDPYSNSKGCAELLASAFGRSFFADPDGTRAGNVIGGGDWTGSWRA